MQRIVRLKKSQLDLNDQELADALGTLKAAKIIDNFTLRDGEVSLVVDAVRAEMVLESLGLEAPNREDLPKRNRRYDD